MEFESQAQRYAATIENELKEGRLNFPTAFDVSLRIKRLADDPDATLEQIGRVVQAEPVLSAKVVRMANSVTLNPYGTPITNVTDGVRRIGLATLRCLAFAVSAEQLTKDHRSKAMRLVASGLWMHSLDVACWSYGLAKRLKVVPPDTALFAGMLIDIGGFFLLARAGDFPELETDMERFGDFVSTWNEPVSRALLDALDMPGEIMDAFDYDDPYGGSWPPRGLGDVLFVAGLATEAPNPLVALDPENRRKLLGLATRGIEPEAFASLIESVKEERQKMLAAVCGP